MRTSSIAILAVTFLVAFSMAATNATNGTNTTNTTYCGNSNVTCTTILSFDACCAVFTGTKTNGSANATNATYISYQSQQTCTLRSFVNAVGTRTLNGYTGSYVCLNNGMILKLTAFVASLGFAAFFL